MRETHTERAYNAVEGHYPPFPRQVVPTPFERAVRLLKPAGGYSTVQLFEGRVSHEALRRWRSGKRRAPVWAYERLAELLEARAAKDIEGACLLRGVMRREAQIGRGAHRNICAWNARRHRISHEV